MNEKSFDESWQEKIYGEGKHMNEYPYDIVVTLIARRFYKIPFERRNKIIILDLGCGAGNNSKFLSEKGFDVYGVDGSETAIEYCKKIFAEKNLKGVFIQSDFLDLPFEDNFFDCIIDRESICANTDENIRQIIDNVFDKLKKNGVFISFIYNNFHPDKRFGEKLSKNTYHNFTEGSFYKAGKVHFIDIKEILEFYKKYNIKNIIRHSFIEVFDCSNTIGEFDEYIIIAEKLE